METITIREKSTSPISIQLKADGNAIDLTDAKYVRMDMIDSESKVYRYTSVGLTSANLIITTLATGSIKFTPPDETIFRYQKQPYDLYVWVYETSSQCYSVPEKEYAEIKLEKEF